MSIIKCKECNSEISDTAVTCPQCGAKTQLSIAKRTRNKTIIIVIVSLIIVAPFAAVFYDGVVRGYYTSKIEHQLKNQGCGEKYISGVIRGLKLIADTDLIKKMYDSNSLLDKPC